MKSMFFVLTVFCLTYGMSSCREPVPVTKIKGNIENFDGGEFLMEVHYLDVNTLKKSVVTIEASIDSMGNFEVQTNKIKEPSWSVKTTIGFEHKWMSISPGDDLYISVDSKNFDESILFSGKGSEKSNYQALKYVRYEDRQAGVNFDHLFELSFDDYVQAQKKMTNDKLLLLDFIYSNEFKDGFYENEKGLIGYVLTKQIIKYDREDDYANFAFTKELIEDIGAHTEGVPFQRYGQVYSMFFYVKYIAGIDSSDLAVYRTGKKVLSGDVLRYFYKESVQELLDGEDASVILSDIESSSIDGQIKSEIQSDYDYKLSIKKKYPISPSNVVFFNNENKKDTFKISGHIVDYNGHPIMATAYDYGVLSKERIDAEIDSNGDFSLRIPVFYSHDVLLEVGNLYKTVFVNPEDQIHLEIKGDEVRFFGDGAKENKLLNEFLSAFQPNNDPSRPPGWVQSDPDDIKQFFIDRYKKQIGFIKNFFANKDSPFIKKWAEYLVLADNFGFLLDFEAYRTYKSRQSGVDLIALPADFYDFNYLIKDINSEGLINAEMFRFMVKGVRGYYVQSKDLEPVDQILYVLDHIKMNKSQIEYEVSFVNILRTQVDQKNFEVIEAMISRYQQDVKTPWLIKEMLYQYDIEKKVFAGLVIPEGADLNQVSETSGGSLITAILDKHQDKVIYIDMWATWCGPCIREFSFANEFYEKIDHTKVALVYLAGQSNENVWKSMIDKYKLKGDHYLLTDEQYDYISSKFEAKGFPHYAIVDQAGVVKYKNAPRPSVGLEELNMSLIEVLNEL